MTDLGIVIVNWNTRELLRRCLETVFASTGAVTVEVIVVDNASSDGSAAMVAEAFPQAHLIANGDNLGYPKANNQGLRALGFAESGGTPTEQAPRYAILLNPDTELPPDALAEMTAYMDAHPDVGVAGPKLVLPDGSLDLACRRSMPSPEVAFFHFSRLSRLFPQSRVFARYNLTFLDENQTSEVDSVVGAFMMVRAACIATVGMLDEMFFMYGEDLDWAKRIKEAGWRVMYYPAVEVKHVKRAASSKSKRAQFEFKRAFLLFYRKHYRQQTPLTTHLAVMAGIALMGGPRLWPEVFTNR
ncbi:MAG: glycosyltransferase family 2 protein [Chloroflexi bacterium]|nr:glycosyltransferase family 2 protein [Chloroflexota bacterium]